MANWYHLTEQLPTFYYLGYEAPAKIRYDNFIVISFEDTVTCGIVPQR